jgi:hypothetical protein
LAANDTETQTQGSLSLVLGKIASHPQFVVNEGLYMELIIKNTLGFQATRELLRAQGQKRSEVW